MKRYTLWLRELEQTKICELEMLTKILEDKNAEIEKLQGKISKVEIENIELNKEISLTNDTLMTLNVGHLTLGQEENGELNSSQSNDVINY